MTLNGRDPTWKSASNSGSLGSRDSGSPLGAE